MRVFSKILIVALGTTVALAACDTGQAPPLPEVTVSFKQTTSDGAAVAIGEFEVQAEPIRLDAAFDTTLADEDPSSLEIRTIERPELSPGSHVIVLYTDVITDVYSVSNHTPASPVLRTPSYVALRTGAASSTMTLRVFALVEPGGYARGPFVVMFDGHEVAVDEISDYAVVASPALSLTGNDLDWQSGLDRYSVSSNTGGAALRTLHLIQEQCPGCSYKDTSSYLGGFGGLLSDETVGTFEYSLYLLER